MQTNHPAFLARLARANRLRWRARHLEIRSVQVATKTRDFRRAFRIKERAERAHLRANLAMQGFALIAAA